MEGFDLDNIQLTQKSKEVIHVEEPAQVRFFHGAVNYRQVVIFIGARLFTSNLGYGNVSPYGDVNGGFRTITVISLQTPKGVILRKEILFLAGVKITLAITNATNIVDLIQILDLGYESKLQKAGGLRLVNLSCKSLPLDLLLSNQKVIFSEVHFKEVTILKRVRPGLYQLLLVRTPIGYKEMLTETDIIETTLDDRPWDFIENREGDYIAFFQIDVKAGVIYTAFIIGNEGYDPPIGIVIEEN